ncbi:MAG: zinc-dependent alcohol dehydrogenase family protein [Planctomycetota bacterium]|nr:zinc-dependent alcohol dehydrogenase family protein [Planctomycetota bacterium]
MRAWVLHEPSPLEQQPLQLEDLPDPVAGPGEIVMDVDVCGLCRTDIHIAQGEIKLPVLPIVPGHQAVGRVRERGEGAERFEVGARVGVAWLHRTCARCRDCARGDENLCRAARFSGYHEPGGFAERVRIHESFAYELPTALDDARAAPLLCAGIIGYRALRQADVTEGESVGLYGFGSSAHLALQLARHRRNRVFVVTRGASHRELALRMGAEWAGGLDERPPEPLDRAVIFAPAGELIPRALEAVRWGGTVASAALHMSAIPEMDYGQHLFGERTLRSTTAGTRRDGIELMETAEAAGIRPEITEFPFEQVNEGLLAIREDRVDGSAVLRVRET